MHTHMRAPQESQRALTDKSLAVATLLIHEREADVTGVRWVRAEEKRERENGLSGVVHTVTHC